MFTSGPGTTITLRIVIPSVHLVPDRRARELRPRLRRSANHVPLSPFVNTRDLQKQKRAFCVSMTFERRLFLQNLRLNGRWWKLIVMILILAATAVTNNTEAQLSIYCTAEASTPERTKNGETCDIAQGKLNDLSFIEAQDACVAQGYSGDLCSTSLVVTQACWYNSTIEKYKIRGYRNYRCNKGEDPPGCDPVCQ